MNAERPASPSPERSVLEEERGPDREHVHLRELDGVRGIAALVVFGHHLLDVYLPNSALWNPVVKWTAKTFSWGAYGVDLFFVLSGFLITSILLSDQNRPHFFWNFYWKRALRILPLYLVSLALLAALTSSSRIYLVMCLLFLANFSKVFHADSSGPYWTLAIEEQFYLIWPQIVRRVRVERLQQIALAIALGCMALRFGATLLGHYNFRFPFFRCDGLALGAVLACQQFRHRRAAGRGETNTRKLPVDLILAASAGMILMTPAMLLVLRSKAWPSAFALQVAGVNLLGYALIGCCVRFAGSPWLSVLRSRVLVFFGAISYCFYMVHAFVILEYDRRHVALAVNDMPAYLIRIGVILTISVTICLFSRYALELPAQHLRRYVLRGRRS